MTPRWRPWDVSLGRLLRVIVLSFDSMFGPRDLTLLCDFFLGLKSPLSLTEGT